MEEMLFIVVLRESGEEVEREWHAPDAFPRGKDVHWKGHDYVVHETIREDSETTRVFLEEVFD